MSVRLQLNDSQRVFTCLDWVTGNVILHVENQETISSITVKMEGISKSRLLVPKEQHHGHQHQGKAQGKAEVEFHKLLYIVEKVFPAPEVQAQSSSSSGYTLPQGTYEYPFKFRIPINNSCRRVDSLLQKISIEKGSVDFARDASQHIRNILPPSLYGMPEDEASVRYFLKVTVNRPQFYRVNLRKDQAFVFLPIEPPRPPPSKSETYARRQHVFNIIQPPAPAAKKKGLFKKVSKAPLPPPIATIIPPRFSIEARLPAPAILVPKEPLGLRVVLVKKEPFTTPVVLRQLQLRLFTTTYVTAHEQRKKIITVMPFFNVHTAFMFGNDRTPIEQELEADAGIWAGAIIPETVPPSFRTCNITRSYQLEITLGLSYGMTSGMDQIALIIPISIYSGIRPPAKLLEQANFNFAPPNSPPHSPPLPPATSASHKPFGADTKSPLGPTPNEGPNEGPSKGGLNRLRVPSDGFAPNSPGGSSSIASPISPMSAQSPLRSRSEIWSHPPADAPPTYEDATLAMEDIAPVDGQRNRVYPQQDGYFTGISEVDLVTPGGHAAGGGDGGKR